MSEYRLKDVATVKTNFEDADFWIKRRGSEHMIGKPTKQFDSEHIGIKVTKTDTIIPEFLYYVFEHLYGRGEFRRLAKGSLKLVHLETSDIKNIKLVDQ